MIEEAGDGRTAISKCEQNTYDYIVLDLELPDIHGTEVVAQIRAAQSEGRPLERNPVIVALSAHSRAEMGDRALAAGYDVYLEKPVGKPEVLSAIFCRGILRDSAAFQTVGPSDHVEIDSDLAQLIAPFLERKRLEVDQMRTAMTSNDRDGVRKLSHRLKGSFQMYGFDKAASLCSSIEQAVTTEESAQILRLVAALNEHMANLEIHFS